MKCVYFHETYDTCSHNSFFLSQVYNFIKANHFRPVKNAVEADYIILCTCGIDTANKAKSKKAISDFYELYGPKATILVTGCFTKLEENFLRYKNISQISISNLHELDNIFCAGHPFLSVRTNVIDAEYVAGNLDVNDEYYIQIGQGCTNNCTYCSIKDSPVALKSKPVDAILSEISDGLQSGFSKFILLADDCGCYGEDINTSFANLLNTINQMQGNDFKLNVHYLHPARLLSLFPQIDESVFRRIYFMNIPVQAVSEKILKLMNRNYDMYEVIKVLTKIKTINPAIVLHSRLIYGYSADAEEEFKKAVELSRVFDKIFHFHHSDYELFSYRCFC